MPTVSNSNHQRQEKEFTTIDPIGCLANRVKRQKKKKKGKRNLERVSISHSFSFRLLDNYFYPCVCKDGFSPGKL